MLWRRERLSRRPVEADLGPVIGDVSAPLVTRKPAQGRRFDGVVILDVVGVLVACAVVGLFFWIVFTISAPKARAQEQVTAVFALAIHVRIKLWDDAVSARVLPDGERYQGVYVSKDDCEKDRRALAREFKVPSWAVGARVHFACEKREIKQ